MQEDFDWNGDTEKTRYNEVLQTNMITKGGLRRGGSSERDISLDREYDSDTLEELDEKLMQAKELADEADYDYLSEVLEYEIMSLYYKSR